jgi:alkanesulfonate monooxygenase SsuD/methylene tetrahydromethanopterin reductase-like flavin-dependent oxidoreductase (luciferase family)
MSRGRQGRLGVSVMPLENRRETLIGAAVTADRLGYDAFFLPESWTFDMTVLLAEAAVRTERITLGTGILGVWSRSPGTLAMAARTLAAVSGGRFVLGLGASTAQLTEGLHDTPFDAPLARMRRVVTQVRALLGGERIPLATATGARPLRLNLPPGPPVPIYLAALADASVRLAGEVADGWMPFIYPRDRLVDGIALLREGAAKAGDTGRPLGVWPTVPTVVDEDAARAREGAAWFVAFYLTTMGPLYRQALVRQGLGAAVEAVVAANTPKLTGVVPAAAEVLLEQLTVYGTPKEARERMARWHAAGADVVGVFLRPNLGPEEIEYTLGAFRPMPGPSGGARP